eukprot:gene14837-19938_t
MKLIDPKTIKLVKSNCLLGVTLETEEPEDMYHLYNLLRKDDAINASTRRNVIIETKSGARDKTRVYVQITVRIESIEFDAEQCSLRINGRNETESEYIQLGQYHTLEIELGRKFQLFKDSWDSVHFELLEEITNPAKKADIAAVVMEEGLAHLCLIKSSMTITCARLERSIPKKKQGNSNADKAGSKFFSDIYSSIKRHIEFDKIKVFLIGSSNSMGDEFMTYMLNEATRENNSSIIKNRSKFVRGVATSGHKNAIDEMLNNPQLSTQLKDVKAASEARILQKFCELLSSNSDRICYGYDHVAIANENTAIEELLISDTIYRTNDFSARDRIVSLMDTVTFNGGKVFKFSSLHSTGEKLNMYTGIAAVLRFPLSDEILHPEDLNPHAKVEVSNG